MDIKLNFSDVPSNWAICFQHDCPLADSCLRHHAAMLVPATLRHHDCVLPAARTADTCALFVEDKPMRIARGMTNILPKGEPWKIAALRQAIMPIFGCRAQFYRYREGRYPINPEQQKRVAAVFRKLDIDTEPHYDQVEEQYYFPKTY